MRIFRACLIMFFLLRVLWQDPWLGTTFLVLDSDFLLCDIYLWFSIWRSFSFFIQLFQLILMWTRVLFSLRTCPAYGVTDYYPFNSYTKMEIVFFVILVIIRGPPFFRIGTTMHPECHVKCTWFCDFLNEFRRFCTRWYIHFS